MKDCMDKTEQTVYILSGITFLPHYTLACFVSPGFSNDTPMQLWTVNQLLDKGAEKSTTYLWTRGLLARTSTGGPV